MSPPELTGLTTADAEERLARLGPNEPAPAAPLLPLSQILGVFFNPLTLILLTAAAVSASLGEKVSAVIIAVIILTSGAIQLVQTLHAHAAIRRLREGVALTATVLRDGRWQELPRREIVPDDLVRLSAGDLVPADARLLQSRDLHVQQAALTGESLPVEKQVGPDRVGPLAPDDPGAVFLGTSVVSGTATARVVATGRATAFGGIAARLTDVTETEFERGIRRFGFFITQTVLLLVLFVFLTGAVLRRDPLQSLLFAVALAVGLTPEFLPMITAVTLARGAVRMARRHVVVKHLAAIQNFGAMDVLCTDKTGTLTRGEMELVTTCDVRGASSVEALRLAYLNSRHETGIKSPLDTAILRQPVRDGDGWRKLDEVPFDFERRRLSVVVEGPEGRLLITKGAPESVLAVCTRVQIQGAAQPFDSALRERALATCRDLSTAGHRLLAVASRPAEEKASYDVSDERDLVLAGFLAFLDPPRPDAAEALRDLKRDGVRVKVLTGDNELVAKHITEQVGLDGNRVVVGADLDRLGDAALAHVAEQTTVFARVSPAQKNRILRALQARGHVVGFLGDGVNDAPSIHAADVGISVASAVDVARDAAEVILLAPGLRVLHSGIVEGRQAFGNVLKYLLMGTSSNFGNMISMALATVFLPFLPMLPMQVLLNNLLYDLAQLPIPTDAVDPVLVRRPHRWDIRLIRTFMLRIGPISSVFDFLTFGVLLWWFQAQEEFFHTGWFVESLATQTLVLLVIRTAGNPFRSRPSRPLVASVLGIVGVGLVLPYLPLASLLGFVPLPAAYFLFLIGATALYLGCVDAVKRRVFRRFLQAGFSRNHESHESHE